MPVSVGMCMSEHILWVSIHEHSRLCGKTPVYIHGCELEHAGWQYANGVNQENILRTCACGEPCTCVWPLCCQSVHICMCACTCRYLFIHVLECIDVRAYTNTHDASVRKGTVLQNAHITPYILEHLCLYSYMNTSICAFVHVHETVAACEHKCLCGKEMQMFSWPYTDVDS